MPVGAFLLLWQKQTELKESCGSGFCRYDEHVHDRFPVGDPSKRAFTYFVLTGGRFVYASALRVAVLKLLLSMTVISLPLSLLVLASLVRGV